MRTEFKDIYQHHTGCLIVDREYPEEGCFVMDIPMINEYIKQHSEDVAPKDHFTDYFKPILYPLSAITDEQKKKVYQLIFKRPFPDTGQIIFRDDKTRSSDPRFVLMTGVDRVGIELNGTVWADCDLSNVKFNQHIITKYFCDWHYNVFGLEPDQFIDPATLPTDPYKQ